MLVFITVMKRAEFPSCQEESRFLGTKVPSVNISTSNNMSTESYIFRRSVEFTRKFLIIIFCRKIFLKASSMCSKHACHGIGHSIAFHETIKQCNLT